MVYVFIFFPFVSLFRAIKSERNARGQNTSILFLLRFQFEPSLRCLLIIFFRPLEEFCNSVNISIRAEIFFTVVFRVGKVLSIFCRRTFEGRKNVRHSFELQTRTDLITLSCWITGERTVWEASKDDDTVYRIVFVVSVGVKYLNFNLSRSYTVCTWRIHAKIRTKSCTKIPRSSRERKQINF